MSAAMEREGGERFDAAAQMAAEHASRGRGIEELLALVLAGRASEDAVALAGHAAATYERVRHERRARWLAWVAHEVRNPLGSLASALWLLRDGGRGEGRLIDIAERAIRRIDEALRMLLDLESRSLHGEPPRGPGAMREAAH